MACSSSSSTGTGNGSSGGGDAGPTQPSFVLVHGAWMGGWAWSDVAAGLQAKGANVAVVELPAHGADTTPISGATLDAYVAKVDAALDASPTPAVLVGHSFGGVVITQAAESRPSRVAKLVYVAALFPKDGQSALDIAGKDAGSHAGPVLKIDPNAGTAGLPADKLEDIFCADCAPDALATLKSHYRDEPLAPLSTPVHTTPANWGSLKKYFVYTKQDNAVSYGTQQSTTAGVTFVDTVTLDTSHSPFLSAPSRVVDTLTTFAQAP
jgi:pimeloyl-ACP methyl ester carboxylesterase